MDIPILFETFKSLKPAFGHFNIFHYFFLYRLGLIGEHVKSVTDILRFLRIEPQKYTAFVQFLESDNINLEYLNDLWQKCVHSLLDRDALRIEGKKVLILDGTLIKKFGKKMPLVGSQYDHSYDCHFQGQKLEMIGLIIKKSWVSLCVPLSYLLHWGKENSMQNSKLNRRLKELGWRPIRHSANHDIRRKRVKR